MKICKNCNINIPKDAIFCPYCGCRIKKDFCNQLLKSGIVIKIYLFIVICLSLVFCFLNLSINKSIETDPKTLTLDKVIQLSEKGEELSWEDFKNFLCEEERYNTMTKNTYRLYRARSPYHFEITITGNRNSNPEKIILYPTYAKYKKVDLRDTKAVEQFIKENKKDLKR